MWCSALHDPNFIVQSLIFLATFLAVVVALFQKDMRARFRPSSLKVELARELGYLATSRLFPPGQALPVYYRDSESRWYHLKVTNPRRLVDAVNNVFVSLLRVEQKGGDGQYYETWSGDVALNWRGEMETRKVIGTWAESDLCWVLKDKWLQLAVRTEGVPINLKWRYRILSEGKETATTLPVDLVVTVQARGNEVDSEEQRYRIYWNGEWKDGEKEMRQHFHVTRL